MQPSVPEVVASQINRSAIIRLHMHTNEFSHSYTKQRISRIQVIVYTFLSMLKECFLPSSVNARPRAVVAGMCCFVSGGDYGFAMEKMHFKKGNELAQKLL